MTQEVLECLEEQRTAEENAAAGAKQIPPEKERERSEETAQERASEPAGNAGVHAARDEEPSGSERPQEKRRDFAHLREHLAELREQAAQIPGFDLREALRDPAFVRLTAPGVGVPVADAWYALHREEEAQRQAEEGRSALARAVAASARRPREGGGAGAALIAADYRSLSREEQLRVKKRIIEAGARGEKIYP